MLLLVIPQRPWFSASYWFCNQKSKQKLLIESGEAFFKCWLHWLLRSWGCCRWYWSGRESLHATCWIGPEERGSFHCRGLRLKGKQKTAKEKERPASLMGSLSMEVTNVVSSIYWLHSFCCIKGASLIRRPLFGLQVNAAYKLLVITWIGGVKVFTDYAQNKQCDDCLDLFRNSISQ